MTLVLPAVTFTAALAGFEALGHSPTELLHRAGLRREQLADPFAGLPDAAFGRLWAAAFALQPDPNLPIQAGLVTPFGAFGILDHLVGSAHTLGEAMQTLALFFRLVSTTITLELRHDAGDSLWLVKTPSSLGDAISDAWTLALLVGRMRSVCASFTAEQISFQELLDAYRQERAMELLREGRLAIGEVAYALGYGEQSAFTRAFRRWTGLAPRAWLTGQSRRDSPARHQ